MLKLISLLLVSCVVVFADLDLEVPEAESCNYPAIDKLSDKVIEYLCNRVPVALNAPDDTKGTWVSRYNRVFELNSFARRADSQYECTERGIRIKVPLKFDHDVKSDFQVSANIPWKGWVKMSGRVVDLEAEAVLDLDLDSQSVHLTSMKVTDMKEVQLGFRGDNIFARAARKVSSLIANWFQSWIKKCIEKTLQKLLQKANIEISLKEFGFE